MVQKGFIFLLFKMLLSSDRYGAKLIIDGEMTGGKLLIVRNMLFAFIMFIRKIRHVLLKL